MNKQLLLAFLGASLVLPFGASAAFVASEWKYMKPVALPGNFVNTQYVKVPIDTETAFAARRDLADLRVIVGGNVEVPYQLVMSDQSVSRDYTGSKMRDLSTIQGETIFALDLEEEGRVHDRLTIFTDAKNYKKSVFVYAADKALPLSDSGWRLVTDRGYIYNYHDDRAGVDVSSGEVRYSENTARYLKVVITNGEGETLTNVSAQVLRFVSRVERQERLEYSARIVENEEMRSTEIRVDLGGSGLPSHQIDLLANDIKNFNRRVVVQSSSDMKSWVPRGNGYVFSLKTPLFSGRQLLIPYDETQDRYLRVIVFNGDDTPVSWVPQVFVVEPLRSLVFAADPGKSYMLYFGNEKAYAPHYDLAQYFQYVESAALFEGSLGKQRDNTFYVKDEPRVPTETSRTKMMLNGVLVILVAVLTFLTIGYLKKLKFEQRGPQNGV